MLIWILIWIYLIQRNSEHLSRDVNVIIYFYIKQDLDKTMTRMKKKMLY